MNELKFLVSLGKKIKHTRKGRQLTQTKLAQQCGFEKASLSRIEGGKANITVLTMRKICRALDIQVAELFTE